MSKRNFAKFLIVLSFLVLTACQRNIFQSPTVAPATFRDVPAQRLNFRFEPDVPPPTEQKSAPIEERNAAVQADFDQNRPQDLLDKTITSPDKQRLLVVYHRAGDVPSEFRLDMYASDGRRLRKITPDGMAVHFPDTIVWSPDSTSLAFVAMIRAGQDAAAPGTPDGNSNTNANVTTENKEANTDTETNANTENANTDTNAAQPPANVPTVAEPSPVLTFRTEQIYVVNSDGDGLKPITQNEGLIYFYYTWSPDSSMLAALATTFREWQVLQYQADTRGEAFSPMGRPRLVEKNGRERRLDDNLTAVRPVFSPDSAKVATAFDRQIRIYDAIGENPTQAGIPLRNELLISSKKYDEELQRQEPGTTETPASGANNQANQTVNTLPDESSLVSFNPIINLEWVQDGLLYLQTGYIKEMKNSAESARSYLRWHRLVLSPQAVALNN